MKPKNLILNAALILSLPAHGAITYVDAVEGFGGNTRATNSTQSNTDWFIPETTSADNDDWVKRTTLQGSNGDTVFQAMPNGSPELIPELNTTLSGLANGTYKVWVFYWDQVTNDTQNWTIAAGLTSGSLTTYSSPGEPAVTTATTVNVSTAASLSFTSSVQVASTDTNRQLFGVYLGEVGVTGGSDINFYVDMVINGSSSASRTLYDGVGYELIPEPSTTLLGGLGLLALLRRRRN